MMPATLPAQLFLEGAQTPAQSVSLHPGLNKIGRRTEPTQSAMPGVVLIDTDDILIHRQYHCQIDVLAQPDNSFRYLLSTYPGASNPTCLGTNNQMPMLPPDQVYLTPDAVFYMGTTAACLRT